jgi:hypothetical protein
MDRNMRSRQIREHLADAGTMNLRREKYNAEPQ